MSDEARKGLIDSVKGKAKEIAGAMIGNDSLTAEGQLEQTQARERKDANSMQAVADAEAEQARVQATEARLEGAEERIAVNARTGETMGSVPVSQWRLVLAAMTVGTFLEGIAGVLLVALS
jgi:uncharacterized protein YjbJ (UPF0337 family)